MTSDPRIVAREQRVNASIDRDLARVDRELDRLRREQKAAHTAADAAEQAEREAWRKFERTGRRRHEFAWRDAMTDRERANRMLLNVTEAIRRLERRYDELNARDEFRRRLRDAERLDALKEQLRARRRQDREKAAA